MTLIDRINLAIPEITRRLTPQAKTIFDHLVSAGSISSVEAHAVHRCRSVSRRITEIDDALVEARLRFLGPFPFSIRKVVRRDSTGQRYTRYFLDRV